ncbi:DUF1592 domain-containing protein [Stigmatella sp. ncwal1]|uniref:DUF1592 domain-containing protein n=1 Tax=Stigmatella ashevillensis TaxID=2995309 RepID=A0ABT5D1M7_9BACT|nr:DUF1592 domain-containing protein [Stigmatella ashevillena]MDC0707569.1 DUF1592 domain-containing protein [Stigmatella ashevillena]
MSSSHRLLGLVRLVSATLLLGGCFGQAELEVDGRPTPGEGGPGGPEEAACPSTGIEPGPSPLRRLTRFEYNNTVRDLLGTSLQPAEGFAKEEESLGFNNNAYALNVTLLHVEQWMEASETLSTAANLDALLPCQPTASTESTCARQFIETFGKRAWRRPLEAEEVSRLLAVYQAGRARKDFLTGIRMTLQAFLQSPYFLYRAESGTPGEPGASVQVSSYEMASRLSYFLWGTMPDATLFQAAEAGELVTPAQVEAQARRMLGDAKARGMVAEFHRQWLKLDEFTHATKDATVYPAFEPLKAAMRTETEKFLDYVFFDSEGSASLLFDAPFTFANKPLADFYGFTGPTGSLFEKVTVNPSLRSGLLTQASFLASHAKPNQSSPIHRGVFVRKQFLCQQLPTPPDNVGAPPDPSPDATTRERFAEHTRSPACSGCHSLIDPVGFGFENYDGAGAFRTHEGTLPVDSSGTVTQAGDAEGAYVGAVELSRKFARSTYVMECVATQWFRYANGRSETSQEQCEVLNLKKQFARSGFNLRELLVQLTLSDAFRYRQPAPAAQ